MKSRMTIFVLGLCLVIAASTGVIAGKGASNKGQALAQATFRDSGDQIRSDGRGTYSTVGNVVCTMDQSTTGTGSFYLDVYSNGKALHRSLWFDYTHPITTACDTDSTSDPTSILNDPTASVSIEHLGDMPVAPNYRGARFAHFDTSAGSFVFAGQYYPNYQCSTNVVATRPDATHWIVTTDALPGETLPVWNPLVHPFPNAVGNIVQLEQPLYSTNVLGNYQMSFQIGIYCPTCK